MNLFDYVLIGIMQGILEWLPVSSKGIESLVLVRFFGMNLNDALVVALWMHIGTLFAALVYYWDEIKEIFFNLGNYIRKPFVKTEANKLTSFVLVTTLLTGAVGVPLFLFGLDKLNFAGKTAMVVIALFLILVGLFQWFARKLRNSEKELRVSDSIWLGLMQGFTAIPGLSRSGVTVSTLLFRGYSPREAVRLSFLVSIPAVLGAEVLLGLVRTESFNVLLMPGIIASFVFGLISIKLLVKVAERINFSYFCVGFGVLIVVSVLLGIV